MVCRTSKVTSRMRPIVSITHKSKGTGVSRDKEAGAIPGRSLPETAPILPSTVNTFNSVPAPISLALPRSAMLGRSLRVLSAVIPLALGLNPLPDPCALIAGKRWVLPSEARRCLGSFPLSPEVKSNVGPYSPSSLVRAHSKSE